MDKILVLSTKEEFDSARRLQFPTYTTSSFAYNKVKDFDNSVVIRC